MNKTWSIILIVVASIVVLGGTFWYFGMQKQKTQEEPTPSAVVMPAEVQPPVSKDSQVVASSAKKEPSLPKQTVEPKETPATEPSPAKAAEEKTVKETLPAETPKQKRQLPAPVAPLMTKDGGFALPSFGNKSEEDVAKKNAQTSVLASEELPAKAEASIPPAIEAKKKEPKPVIEEPVVQEELPDIAGVEAEEIQVGKNLESKEEEPVDEVLLLPVTEEPVEIQPETEQESPAVVAETPPALKILRSETVGEEEGKATDDKPAIEASLSVSFLDYNFPKDFSPHEKGFNVSVDVMNQKEVFGWGGTLEVGRNTTTKVVQISLLAKTAWKLGEDVVTFPLSISLGPTIFIDSVKDTTEFGMKAKLSAGVTYAISESFRMFYAIGVGVTYNFQDSSSFRFVLEPIRVGVGFSF